MLTYLVLAKSTIRNTIESAKAVRISGVESRLLRDSTLGAYQEFTYSAYTRKRSGVASNKCTLRQFAQNPRDLLLGFAPSKKTWVSCTCSYFKFVCEYALAKAGASEIRYCNGRPPKNTNPALRPMLCKHLTAFGLSPSKLAPSRAELEKVLSSTKNRDLEKQSTSLSLDSEDLKILGAAHKQDLGIELDEIEMAILKGIL